MSAVPLALPFLPRRISCTVRHLTRVCFPRGSSGFGAKRYLVLWSTALRPWKEQFPFGCFWDAPMCVTRICEPRVRRPLARCRSVLRAPGGVRCRLEWDMIGIAGIPSLSCEGKARLEAEKDLKVILLFFLQDVFSVWHAHTRTNTEVPETSKALSLRDT